MSHIAIQEALNGSNVAWMVQVTDEQYRGQQRLAGKSLTKVLRVHIREAGRRSEFLGKGAYQA